VLSTLDKIKQQTRETEQAPHFLAQAYYQFKNNQDERAKTYLKNITAAKNSPEVFDEVERANLMLAEAFLDVCAFFYDILLYFERKINLMYLRDIARRACL
jgi:uncharacterized membrane protein YebE (DUF533 family)